MVILACCRNVTTRRNATLKTGYMVPDTPEIIGSFGVPLENIARQGGAMVENNFAGGGGLAPFSGNLSVGPVYVIGGSGAYDFFRWVMNYVYGSYAYVTPLGIFRYTGGEAEYEYSVSWK